MNGVFQPGNRQTRTIFIRWYKRTPSGYVRDNRKFGINKVNRCKPAVDPPRPLPESGIPNFFQSGTGPSSILVFSGMPVIEIAANAPGSLKISGLFLTDM